MELWQLRGIGMRNILFKGKKIDNGEWIYGDLFTIGNKKYIHPQSNVDFVSKTEITKMNEVDPDTVCQWTGLIALDHNKVWENDIVIQQDGKYYETVEYIQQGYYPWALEDCKVVGNIFDNPELLEE